MSLWLQEDQRVKVTKNKSEKENMKHYDNYTVANVTSSRKNTGKDSDTVKYLYSDWGFVRFVGKAHTYMMENVQDGDIIIIKKAQMTKEPYTKNGVRVYPKSEQIVVFSVESYVPKEKNEGTSKSSKTAKQEVLEPEDDDIPF